jgi:hypothetical protein
MSDLRDEVEALLARRSLSDAQLRALERLQSAAPGRAEDAPPGAADSDRDGTWQGRHRSPRRRPRPPSARRLQLPRGTGRLAAAALLTLLLASALWLTLPASDGDPARAIAREVADNHLQLKPLQFSASALDELRGDFSRLSFRLRDSALPALAELSLRGGRYCSIQGAPAAQFRLVDTGAEHTYTLYQARYEPERFGDMPRVAHRETPRLLRARGLSIRLWVEQDVLFALVAD